MRENRVRRILREGKAALGGWLTIPSAFSAEVMAHQGFDWLCIDMQHGVIDYDSAVGMLQAISTTPTVPFVRVPWNDPATIMKMLDAGAYGIIIPLVNSRAAAETAVAACRYPPQGIRSFGPIRAAYYAGDDYAAHANDELYCMPMVETATALEHLDEILSVPGIDAIFVGPADLSLSLGLSSTTDNRDPALEKALARIVEGCDKHNVVPGIATTASLAAQRLAQGFRMVRVSSDIDSLAQGAATDLSSIQPQQGEAGASPAYQ